MSWRGPSWSVQIIIQSRNAMNFEGVRCMIIPQGSFSHDPGMMKVKVASDPS